MKAHNFELIIFITDNKHEIMEANAGTDPGFTVRAHQSSLGWGVEGHRSMMQALFGVNVWKNETIGSGWGGGRWKLVYVDQQPQFF